MKKSLWLALMLVLAVNAGAVSYKSVLVTLLDGSTSQINLSEDLKTTFDEENIIFSDGTFTVELEKAQVNKFEFSETTGIDQAQIAGATQILKSGILTLNGMPDNSKVSIFTTSGKCVYETSFSQSCSIDLNALPAAIYVVKVNNVSLKIALTK